MYDCDDNESRFGQPINGKLLVLGRSAAADFTFDRPWACISIGTEPGDWPKINRCQLVDLLQVAFFDLDRMPDISDTEEIVLFNEDHARQIWEFVDAVWDRVDLLLVHCLAGVARSPAVAAAIARVKYGDDKLYFKCYIPNSLVYRTMVEYSLRNNMHDEQEIEKLTAADLAAGTLKHPKEFGIWDTKDKT